jgi:alpha-beta hydrolase superfamily lysophospholipase
MSAPQLYLDARWHSKPIGVVSIVHGAGDHSGRYAGLRDALDAARFSTAVLDLRGHGRSAGRPLDVRVFEEYREDYAGLRNLVDARRDGVPHFLLGHSMGTLIVLDAIERSADGVSGAVLMSAALRPGGALGRIAAKCAGAAAAVAPTLRLPLPLGFRRRELTTDPAERSKVRRDELMHTWATLRWGAALNEAMAAASAGAEAITVPVLFLHGAEDRIADWAAAREVFQRASSRDKTFLTFPGARHELFAEVPAIRGAAIESLVEWLSTRASGQASPAS